MDTLEALLTRSSAAALVDPPPPPALLDVVFRCAMAAPDHGRLKTARFIVVEGAARQRLGQILVRALQRRHPEAPPDAVEREARKPERAPMIVVAACAVQKGHKIPEIEQVLAVGAAIENVLVALHASGFGAMWKTGEPAYDAGVKAELGLGADDQIVGFIYVGTPAGAPKVVDRSVPPGAVRRM